jgi:membrane protease YdiL (CAAX protease family)
VSQRSEARRESDPPLEMPAAARPERLGLEVLAVLGVSLGLSAVYALLYLIRAEITVSGGIGNTTATVIQGTRTTYPLLDLADDLADILNGIAPPLLALVLLARTPGGPGLGIGLNLRDRWREAAQGVGFLALIGIPGLGLVWSAHELGLNASLAVVDFPDVWYRMPYLLLSAFQNGFAEEIVVVGYLLTRLRQLGWSDSRALAASSVLRGSYHLYQGFGGFAGNLVMGVIFGYWFQRTRRVLPLVIAHFLLDAVSFVGYLYLHEHISWI